VALLDKFTQFIQSPGATGLAAGLLQGSGPSMTQPSSFGGAFGQGLSHMQRAQEEEAKRKLAKDVFGLDKERFGLEKQGLTLKQVEAYRKYLEDQALNEALGVSSPQVPQSAFFGDSASPVAQAMGQGQTNQPPPQDTADAYAVKDPRINGGKLSYIPMQNDTGQTVSRDQAINEVLANPERAIGMVAAGEPDQAMPAAILQPNMVSPPAAPQGGLLSNLSPEQAQWAKTSKLLGGKEGLLKALEPEKKSEKVKLAERLFPGDKAKQDEYLMNPQQNAATRAFLTQNQKVVQAIDNVLPKVEELVKQDVPYQNPMYLGGLPAARIGSPQRMADYEAKVASITDTLVGALSLPNTNESLHLVSTMISKQPNEGDTAYRKRLKALIEDLEIRRENAEAVAPRVGNPAPPRKSNAQSANDPLGWRQ